MSVCGVYAALAFCTCIYAWASIINVSCFLLHTRSLPRLVFVLLSPRREDLYTTAKRGLGGEPACVVTCLGSVILCHASWHALSIYGGGWCGSC